MITQELVNIDSNFYNLAIKPLDRQGVRKKLSELDPMQNAADVLRELLLCEKNNIIKGVFEDYVCIQKGLYNYLVDFLNIL